LKSAKNPARNLPKLKDLIYAIRRKRSAVCADQISDRKMESEFQPVKNQKGSLYGKA